MEGGPRYEMASFTRAPQIIFDWARAVAGGAAEPPAEVLGGLRREIGPLDGVAPTVLSAQLDAVLMDAEVVPILVRLQRWGVLALLLPEVEAIVGLHESCAVHHKDLWAHTLEVVGKIAPEVDLRWAALMHDTGKVATRAVDADGKVSFLRHEAVGARLMRGVGARLELPAARVERIAFVVANHGRANAYERRWSDRAVARFARAAGARLPDLLAFARADWTTKRSAKAAKIRADFEDLCARLAALERARASVPRFPSGLGRVIRERLGIPEGPQVGAALAWLDREIDAGRLAAGSSADTFIRALRERDSSRAEAVGGQASAAQKG